MITPAYSLTATERVLPRLALDFTTASLDPRITFTRTGNTATVTNADGSVSIANANLPRFDYLNGVCRGLLIEEARTNLLLNSVFDGAVAGTPGTKPTDWLDLQVTGTISSVSTGIYAAGNAIRIVNSGTRRAFYRVQALLANTTYTYSIRITVNSTPVAGFPRIQDCMNLAGGPVGSTVTYLLNGAAATATTAIPNGQTSTVVAIIAVSVLAGNVEVRWGLGIGSTVDGDVTIQMPQLETGAFSTSYIPTEATTVTRNADVATMTGTNFSDWFNPTEGTLACWFNSFIPSGTVKGIISVGSVPNNYIDIRTSSTLSSVMVTNNVQQTGLTNISYSSNTNYKSVTAYKENNCVAASNATLSSVDTVATIPTCDTLYIGSTIALIPSSGHFQKILYWPQRLTNNEIQAFSK
jgi:hypothetical protein